MSLSELLSLVTLTKEYIFENVLPRKNPIVSAAKPQEVPKKAPLIIKAPPPLPSKEIMKIADLPVLKPLEVKKTFTKPQELDLKEILSLLGTHCPFLQLIDPPEETLRKIFVVFDNEPQEERQILNNIANALKKENKGVEFTSLSGIDLQQLETGAIHLLIGERALFLKEPLFKKIARRDEKGQLFFGKTQAFVIPSLAELISTPVLRRELWNQINESIRLFRPQGRKNL